MKNRILCVIAAGMLAAALGTGCRNSEENGSSSVSQSSSGTSSSSVSSGAVSAGSSSNENLIGLQEQQPSVSSVSSSSSISSSSSSSSAASSSSEKSSSASICSLAKSSSSAVQSGKSSAKSTSSKSSAASSAKEPEAVQDPNIIGPYNRRQTADEAAFCDEVFRLTNQQRANYGLEPLKKMDKLSALAVQRAWENTVTYGHTRPNGTSCFTILKENGLNYLSCAENVAMGQLSPSEVVNGWMNSTGHRENILDPDLEYMGAGYYYENGRRCWSQLFFTPANW